MTKGNQKNKPIKNDLKGDPDFDLDEFIDKNSEDDAPLFNQPLEPEKTNSSSAKNLVLVAATILFAIWWFDNDFNPFNNFSTFFGSSDNVTQVAPPPPRIDNNLIPPLPPAPTVNNGSVVSSLDMPLTDYLAELKELGFLEDKISTFSARQVYDGGVPVSYLQELDNAGLLEDLSFVYINSYYQNGTPTSYLNELKNAGIYDGLSFVYVNSFYENGVTTEYLQQLDEANYLDELSFVYINSYYDAGVTTEFLDRLKEQGLYDDLSFLDVVDLFQREGNN